MRLPCACCPSVPHAVGVVVLAAPALGAAPGAQPVTLCLERPWLWSPSILMALQGCLSAGTPPSPPEREQSPQTGLRLNVSCAHTSRDVDKRRLFLPGLASAPSFLPRSLYFPPASSGNTLVCANCLSRPLWVLAPQTHLCRWFQCGDPWGDEALGSPSLRAELCCLVWRTSWPCRQSPPSVPVLVLLRRLAHPRAPRARVDLSPPSCPPQRFSFPSTSG